VQSGIRLGPARRVLERRPVAEPLAQGAASPGIARDPTSPSIPRRVPVVVPVVVPGGARIADLGRGSVVEEQGGAPAWRGAGAGAAAGQDREREDREERHTRLAPNSARSLEGRQAEQRGQRGQRSEAHRQKETKAHTLELTLKLTLTPTRTFGLTHSPLSTHALSPSYHTHPHTHLTLTLSPPILPPIASSSPLVHQPLPLPLPLPPPPPPPPTTSIPSIPRTHHALPLPQIDDGPAIAIDFAFAIPPSHRQRAWNSLLDRCFCPLIDQFESTTSAGDFAGAGLPSQSPSVPSRPAERHIGSGRK
jgi:hypothetical protein